MKKQEEKQPIQIPQKLIDLFEKDFEQDEFDYDRFLMRKKALYFKGDVPTVTSFHKDSIGKYQKDNVPYDTMFDFFLFENITCGKREWFIPKLFWDLLEDRLMKSKGLEISKKREEFFKQKK